MGRNRVVNYSEVDILNVELTNVLTMGYALCGEWDQTLENLKATMDSINSTVSSEYVSSSLSNAINAVPKYM